METGRLLDRPMPGSGRSARVLPAAVPVLWLGLGLAVWGVGLFEPGNQPVEMAIVAVLAGVLLMALTAPGLAEAVLVALALVTPTLTMIVAALADRLGDGPPAGDPVTRTLVTIAVVTVPALVAAALLAHTRHS